MDWETEEWIKWVEFHGWHQPNANDLIPTSKLEDPLDQPIEWSGPIKVIR